MYPKTVGRSLQEIEKIFNQSHTFSAWKIGNDVGKKMLKEVVGKSNDLEVTLLSSISFYLDGLCANYLLDKTDSRRKEF